MRLRYGDNPGRAGSLHIEASQYPILGDGIFADPFGVGWSATDLLNIDIAARVLSYQTAPTALLIKHALVVGGCHGQMPTSALLHESWGPWQRAGRDGTLAINQDLDPPALELLSKFPIDLLVLVGNETGQLERSVRQVSASHPNRRLRTVVLRELARLPRFDGDPVSHESVRTLLDGSRLSQDPPISRVRSVGQFRTDASPERIADVASDLLFAWRLACASRTNAAVIVSYGTILFIAAGRPDGESAVEDATQAAAFGAARRGVLATDGNLPYGVPFELLTRAGIVVLVLPGGAPNDHDVTAEASKRGIAVCFTGERGFAY